MSYHFFYFGLPFRQRNTNYKFTTRVTDWLQLTTIMSYYINRPLQHKIKFWCCPISNGNRTEWSPIRSVIIRVINKIGWPRSGSLICLITSMIMDRIGRHEVLLPINHNFNKICDMIGYFFNKNTRNSKFCFASSEKKAILVRAWWRVLSNYLGMTRTVLLNCPIKAEIRAVDSQSDLTILL